MSDCVYMALLIVLFLLVLLCSAYLYLRYKIDETKNELIKSINDIFIGFFRREAKETK